MSTFERRKADASYRPKGYGLSPSLQRARAPFRARNALTGLVLAGFGVGVWAYSISAVKQENFDDVDAEALSVSVEDKAKRVSIEDEHKAKTSVGSSNPVNPTSQATPPSVPSSTPPSTQAQPDPPSQPASRGVLPHVLGNRFGALHPTQGTLVWDAPPVDRIGTIWDRK